MKKVVILREKVLIMLIVMLFGISFNNSERVISANTKTYGAIAKLNNDYEIDNVFIAYNNGKELICATGHDEDNNYSGYIYNTNGKLLKKLKNGAISVQCNVNGNAEVEHYVDGKNKYYNEKGEEIQNKDEITFYLSDYFRGVCWDGITIYETFYTGQSLRDSIINSIIKDDDEEQYLFVDSNGNENYLYPSRIDDNRVKLGVIITPELYFFSFYDIQSDSTRGAIVKYDGTIIENGIINNNPFVLKSNNYIVTHCSDSLKLYNYNGKFIKSICKGIKVNEGVGPLGTKRIIIVKYDSSDHYTRSVINADIVDLNGNSLTKEFNDFNDIGISSSDEYFAAKSGKSWYLFKFGETDKIKIEDKRTTSNSKSSKNNITNIKKTNIKKITAKKKSLTVSWEKVSDVNGYKFQYALEKNFKKAKTKKIEKASKTSLTIKKLKHKKKYYIRIETFKVVDGKTYYSGWSKVKSKKTK